MQGKKLKAYLYGVFIRIWNGAMAKRHNGATVQRLNGITAQRERRGDLVLGTGCWVVGAQNLEPGTINGYLIL